MKETAVSGGLSFILPGAGQVARGKFMRGYIFLILWVFSLYMFYKSYVDYSIKSALEYSDAGMGFTIFFALIAIGVHLCSVLDM